MSLYIELEEALKECKEITEEYNKIKEIVELEGTSYGHGCIWSMKVDLELKAELGYYYNDSSGKSAFDSKKSSSVLNEMMGKIIKKNASKVAIEVLELMKKKKDFAENICNDILKKLGDKIV